ncbi:MAG: AsmA family protein [Hyphomicrobiales bacterium]|nr:AsmA family protein [Hyphomicrobiales bacterium]
MSPNPSTSDDAAAAAGGSLTQRRGVWRRYVWVDKPADRALRIAGLVAAALGVGAAIAPWTVSRGALREEIAAQLRSSSGLYVFTNGPSTFSLLPRPTISLEKISFVDPRNAMVIEAERMTGQVRWLPLLAGRLELYRATLDRPKLTVDVDGSPMTAAGAAVRAADARASTPEAAKADAARLGVVTFVDGEAQLRRRGKTVDRLTHIDATLDWPTVAAPAALDGEATWRDQRGALSIWVKRPSDLLRGETSPVTVDLKSDAIKLNASGAGSVSPRAQFEGRVVASTSSLRNVARILGGGARLPLTLGPAALDAKAEISPLAVNLGSAHFSLDGADYDGALAWRADDERPQLSGTLATKSIDIREALRFLPGIVGDDGQFSGEPLVWRDRDAFDMDLRISAARAAWDRVQARDVAGALIVHEGRLDASIADASLYKGDLKARLILGPDDQGKLGMKATVQARDIDWSAFSWDRFGDSHVSGQANGHLSVEGQGSTFAQIARSLAGHGDLDITNGDIIGIDIDRALRRIDRRPLASAVDIRSGRTAFDRAHISAKITDGLATIDDGGIESEKFAVALTGQSQIPERQFDLHAVVTPLDQTDARKSLPPAFAFDIGGPWDHASITPDAQGFIKRSGAAKPLFAAPDASKPAQ